MLLTQDIPYFVEIERCNCRVWYSRQPVQCSICREVGHRAPACPLSGRCRRCHQPGHVARECTQAWGPPLSVSRTDHSMDVEEDSGASPSDSEVPSTTASVTLPAVTSPPVMSTSPVTAVCSTVAAPTSRPTVAVTTRVNVSTATMTTAASVPSASVKVSTASAAESSNSDASTASVPRPKKSRTVVSSRIFRQRLANHYTSVELPSFDDVTGKEWDSRARAYVRQKVRIIFEDKRIGLTKRDFVSWTIEDLGALSIDICKVLSIKNYLTEFVFDIIKGYWTNDRITLGET
ncbi:PREDICTED: branchpoint-bridging protein-like [Acropora digitifera]|uniref:branchpoint-bridging protein-like n=1 Tax=Acropora digitifera TaxID=70779 RepID=UPI00077A4EC4|nr:PREDICTED: branchpoint-bridging protein-like [Acropora digitifera]